jgi:hypothetical protein
MSYPKRTPQTNRPGLGGCGGRKAISAEAEKQSPQAMQDRSLTLLQKELKTLT